MSSLLREFRHRGHQLVLAHPLAEENELELRVEVGLRGQVRHVLVDGKPVLGGDAVGAMAG